MGHSDSRGISLVMDFLDFLDDSGAPSANPSPTLTPPAGDEEEEEEESGRRAPCSPTVTAPLPLPSALAIGLAGGSAAPRPADHRSAPDAAHSWRAP